MLQVFFGLILLTFYHPYFTFFGAFLLLGLYLILRITGPKGLETSLIESKYKYRAVHGCRRCREPVHSVQVCRRRARCPWTGWTTW